QDFIPDFSLMKRNGIDKLIITARGTEVDFVSRFFAPGVGVDEDPVTGSAHSQLIPYWSRQLNKSILTARQLSARGGELHCTQVNDERVTMSGRAVLFMKGEIYV
ncbi:MAG TPA: PhzF family phenazine biosynthesis protein, partial [Ferruginibacter sp.]|nr:PhzF family phenazine biosynthesis protein [Ferruginibacter sp.]